MSVWREIWKEAVEVNKLMILKRDFAALDFKLLLSKYGDDGMIYYEKGEAYEILGSYDEALLNFEKAKELFPVPHWKKVSEFSIERVKSYSYGYVAKSYDDFYSLQWNSFHDIHKFLNIMDENRYLGISALTRIDSEPVGALINFRTIMEKELKAHFQDVVQSLETNFCLSKALSRLKIEKVDWKVLNDMDNLRKEGNYAVHENEYHKEYLKRTIHSFVRVMKYFDSL